jgi:hypothetical protein
MKASQKRKNGETKCLAFGITEVYLGIVFQVIKKTHMLCPIGVKNDGL